MKEQDIHSVLWQKRNELRITDDVQQDWLGMQATLDMQIPAGTPPAGSGGLSGFSGLKILSVLVAALGAATLIYFAIQKNQSKNNNHKKDTKTVAVVRGNNQAANSTNTDSLSVATPSTNLSAMPSSANTDKAKAGVPLSSNTRSGNTVGNSADAGNTRTTQSNNKKTNNVLRGDEMIIGANNHTVKGSSIVIANNKTHNNGRVTTRPGSSPLTHAPNNDVKTTRPVNHITKPGADATGLQGSGTGSRIVSGHGLVRFRHTRPPHAFNGSGNNALSKLRSGHSSRKGKNNLLNGHTKPGVNGRDQYTGTDKNIVADTSSTLKNNTDQNVDLADAVQTKFVPERYVPAALSSAPANQFKGVQNGSPTVKAPNTKNSKLDWGILTGVNTGGSFTAKSQNSNFYGSFPVDMFFGLFATYNFSDKWGVNLGIRGLNPQTVSGSYSHANDSKIDTLQTLNISDSRKVYFVDVPLNLVFKPTPYLGLKAGAVFSLPIKQVNGSSTFQTGKLKKDSLYYVKVTQIINATNYTQSINMGLSLGASLQTGRFVVDAAYIRGLKGLAVGSTLGSYTANSNYFLFTIGFKLNRLKK